MAALTTLPVITFLRPRFFTSCSVTPWAPHGRRACERPSGVPPKSSGGGRCPAAALESGEVLELAHPVPEAQVEKLLMQLADPVLDLVLGHVADLLRLELSHLSSPPDPAARRTSSSSAACLRPASSPSSPARR